MTHSFERLAIVGLGLLGGSVGLAARERGLARKVVGVGRRADTLEVARRRGAVDEGVMDPGQAFEGADLVVLATPIATMPVILRGAAARLSPGALLTDVGSVKTSLAENLPGLLPEGVSYVGAHPMAGSHLRGVEHARADLFQGAACVVTATPGTDREAVERVTGFWQALGARVLERDPASHDQEVAWVSHLPHALAFAFAHALRSAPAAAAELRASGFRDFTRIAQSDPELWADILVTNRKAMAGPLQAMADHLSRFARLLETGEAESLERFLGEAREALAPGANDSTPDPGANTRQSAPSCEGPKGDRRATHE